MPPPAAPSAPSIRVDRQAEYQIALGESLTSGGGGGGGSGFSSFKYNHKPPTIALNPSSPTLTQTQSGYNLTFAPSSQNGGKPVPREVVYSATTSTPSQKAQHFLLYDPETKSFTLERLDAAFVFNAEVYTKLHPVLKVNDGDKAESSAGSGSEDDEEEATGCVYDYRNFLGRTSLAEEKRQKRLGALKRAGKDVIDLPEPEEDAGEDADIIIPDAVHPPQHLVEDDSDMDAPGESDDEMMEVPPPLPPPPPPPAPAPAPKKKAPPKPKTKAPPSLAHKPRRKPPPPPHHHHLHHHHLPHRQWKKLSSPTPNPSWTATRKKSTSQTKTKMFHLPHRPQHKLRCQRQHHRRKRRETGLCLILRRSLKRRLRVEMIITWGWDW
ncbi:hypothetical protein BDD12DRAFT_525284 [Trichophaea hybrida]|nr:hypothetical protein BDD12DRAFT_525284 [Trichophaea hybrida]